MKYIILISALTLVFSNLTFAQESGYGVGIIVGEPTGLSGKIWLDEEQAFDVGIAAGFLGNGAGLSIHSDYLYHIKDLINWKYKTPFYYGFGVRMRFPAGSSFNFGMRGVAGLMFYVKKLPVDVFFEIAPSFRLLPTTGLDLDIAIGGRYFFKI